MAVFRFLAAVFLLVATVALVVDATPAVYGAGPFIATTLNEQWKELGPSSFEVARKAVQGAAPWLWDNVLAVLLSVPTYMAFGGLALLAGFIGRRRNTVRIFVN
jgi:hypothetical protein